MLFNSLFLTMSWYPLWYRFNDNKFISQVLKLILVLLEIRVEAWFALYLKKNEFLSAVIVCWYENHCFPFQLINFSYALQWYLKTPGQCRYFFLKLSEQFENCHTKIALINITYPYKLQILIHLQLKLQVFLLVSVCGYDKIRPEWFRSNNYLQGVLNTYQVFVWVLSFFGTWHRPKERGALLKYHQIRSKPRAKN